LIETIVNSNENQTNFANTYEQIAQTILYWRKQTA